MIQLKDVGENVKRFGKYFERSKARFCDFSVGVKYMWREDFVISYAFFNDTLIMRESCADYKNAFYFPFAENADDENAALKEIEDYCASRKEELKFCCIDDETAEKLKKRYPFCEISFNRDWSDYIYNASDFTSFAGKRFSGQRNHVNAFKRSYPDYKFCVLTEEDIPRVKEFLKEYERETVISVWSEKEEEKKVAEFAEKSFELDQSGAFIEVNGKIVALSIGEVVGDTLIVHVEKGLKEYRGVYPAMASEFAKAFCKDGVKFINREEDCGDPGLRISKTQYHPIEIKNKYIVQVSTAFDKIVPPVSIKTERLTVDDITEKDKEVYARIYLDDDLNKYYGYDYREDLGGNTPNADYFYSFMQGLKDKKEEYSFAVRRNGEMLGELVLYNFGFNGQAETGFRFLPEYQGKGYATEAAAALIEKAKTDFCINKLCCRAFKENLPSIRLIKRLGFKQASETDNMLFFEKNL